ncbi:hypothetical protein AXFE_28670 [Acidithrix ferrooxidans]|uniref:Uncharacterized protein n=1 Tax=Acidithrix ferrooxidans TaxID=1280514 RepID=A0A0D8HEE2_9ACTN|nr:hypothetical protein AXFE_28670 [Acidithrix ferrooxidans]
MRSFRRFHKDLKSWPSWVDISRCRLDLFVIGYFDINRFTCTCLNWFLWKVSYLPLGVSFAKRFASLFCWGLYGSPNGQRIPGLILDFLILTTTHRVLRLVLQTERETGRCLVVRRFSSSIAVPCLSTPTLLMLRRSSGLQLNRRFGLDPLANRR